jgi:uncharacterized protein involved in exopolysaccharide biosynthesis
MNGNDTGSTQISARELFAVIFRRRVPILVCALIVAAAALSAATRAKTFYDATATVLLRRTGASALATTWTPFYGLEEEMNTEVEIVTANPVLTRAVEILNEKGVMVTSTVKDKTTERLPTLADLSGGVSAVPVEASNIMRVKFRSASPSFARAAANAVAEAYVEYRVIARKTTGIEDYYQDQISRLDNQLMDLHREDLQLRKQGNVYDREWQDRTIINRQYELKLKLNQTRSRRVAEEAKLAAMKQRFEDDPGVIWPFAVGTDDKLADEQLTSYWKLRAERDDLASGLTLSNPEVRMMDDRLAKMEQQLREEAQRRIKDEEYLIEDLKMEEAADQSEIDGISAELLPDTETVARVEHLEKVIYYTYLHYDRLLEKWLDTMASEADDIRISNAKVLSPAEVKMTKAGQMRSVYVVFSVVLGVTLGIGFGFLLENLDHSIKSASDVTGVVGVPLLGSIPDTEKMSKIGGRIRDSFGPGTE